MLWPFKTMKWNKIYSSFFINKIDTFVTLINWVPYHRASFTVVSITTVTTIAVATFKSFTLALCSALSLLLLFLLECVLCSCFGNSFWLGFIVVGWKNIFLCRALEELYMEIPLRKPCMVLSNLQMHVVEIYKSNCFLKYK